MQCKLSNPLQDEIHFLRPSVFSFDIEVCQLGNIRSFTRSPQITDVAQQQLALMHKHKGTKHISI
jgi:hypothetical protein